MQNSRFVLVNGPGGRISILPVRHVTATGRIEVGDGVYGTDGKEVSGDRWLGPLPDMLTVNVAWPLSDIHHKISRYIEAGYQLTNSDYDRSTATLSLIFERQEYTNQ